MPCCSSTQAYSSLRGQMEQRGAAYQAFALKRSSLTGVTHLRHRHLQGQNYVSTASTRAYSSWRMTMMRDLAEQAYPSMRGLSLSSSYSTGSSLSSLDCSSMYWPVIASRSYYRWRFRMLYFMARKSHWNFFFSGWNSSTLCSNPRWEGPLIWGRCHQ